MNRRSWIWLGVICGLQWVALDAAHYLGRLKGHDEAMETVKVFDAGLAAGGSGFRLCSGRAADRDGGSTSATKGSSGMNTREAVGADASEAQEDDEREGSSKMNSSSVATSGSTALPKSDSWEGH